VKFGSERNRLIIMLTEAVKFCVLQPALDNHKTLHLFDVYSIKGMACIRARVFFKPELFKIYLSGNNFDTYPCLAVKHKLLHRENTHRTSSKHGNIK